MPEASDYPGGDLVAVVEDDVRFDRRDATLLAAIDEHGSVNGAAGALGRSHARSLTRIGELESAFGELVERTRGGSGGGGSRLTDAARRLLDRFDRLAMAMAATASVEETVLSGRVTGVDGELATVASPIGRVRGLHDGLSVDDAVQIRIASDALTLHAADDAIDPDTTSARNRHRGRVTAIDRGETVHTVDLDVDGVPFFATITGESRERLALAVDDAVVCTWKATATRVVPTHVR